MGCNSLNMRILMFENFLVNSDDTYPWCGWVLKIEPPQLQDDAIDRKRFHQMQGYKMDSTPSL